MADCTLKKSRKTGQDREKCHTFTAKVATCPVNTEVSASSPGGLSVGCKPVLGWATYSLKAWKEWHEWFRQICFRRDLKKRDESQTCTQPGASGAMDMSSAARDRQWKTCSEGLLTLF